MPMLSEMYRINMEMKDDITEFLRRSKEELDKINSGEEIDISKQEDTNE